MGAEERRQAFGARLREARQAKGLSLRELGEQVGVTLGTVSNLELGRRGVREDVVIGLEDALGLDRGELGWLLGFAPAPDTPEPEEAIRADRSIPDDHKRTLLAHLAEIRKLDPSLRKD